MHKEKRGLGDNQNPIEEALYKKLEEAKELILKSINKTNGMQKPTEECFNLREESADLGIDAVNKIDEVMSEVKNEK